MKFLSHISCSQASVRKFLKGKNPSFEIQMQIWKRGHHAGRVDFHKNRNIPVIFSQHDLFSKSTTRFQASGFYILWHFKAIYLPCHILKKRIHCLQQMKMLQEFTLRFLHLITLYRIHVLCCIKRMKCLPKFTTK